MTLLLNELHVLEIVGDPSTAEISQIEHDSRKVAPGALFCCLPGARTDGHDHAAAAVERGAVALLCEHVVELPELAATTDAASTTGTAGAATTGGGPRVVQVRVGPGMARPAMARAAAAFYGHPADAITVAGVTGTNGKTTVSHLIGAVLGASGTPTTVIGTFSGARTTPEATELQRQLAEVRDAQRSDGVGRAVAMEVSSHALVQARVDGVRFDVAVFTNLGRDHLDYHRSMEEYFAAKASLFTPERSARAVIAAGDEWGARLARMAASSGVPTTVVEIPDRHLVRSGPGWSTFPWRGQMVRTQLTGAVNVVNALLAAEAAVCIGVDPEAVAEGIARADPVPGRMDVVACPPEARSTVVVDYAHTPDALSAVLADARRMVVPGGRLVVVLGAGGDRDRGKRPEMGAVAAQLADLVVLTSDNPRHEDPAAIIADIAAGISDFAAGMSDIAAGTPDLASGMSDLAAGTDGASEVRIVEDRRAAIDVALRAAGHGDVVLVAGKGHERVQEVGDTRLPFDDRSVVVELLEDA